MGFFEGIGVIGQQMWLTLKKTWHNDKLLLLGVLLAIGFIAGFLARFDALQFNRSRRQWVDFREFGVEEHRPGKFIVWFIFLSVVALIFGGVGD